jgi:hypothetical protein
MATMVAVLRVSSAVTNVPSPCPLLDPAATLRRRRAEGAADLDVKFRRKICQTAGLHAPAEMGLSGRLEFDSSNHGLC